ncbi:hypothetical protein EDC01DRAFT_234443 [Geopyxis carbonaria]|nr:hypothetical protein EDC01DRAFT_234443 [Geopyxis carbonaria]
MFIALQQGTVPFAMSIFAMLNLLQRIFASDTSINSRHPDKFLLTLMQLDVCIGRMLRGSTLTQTTISTVCLHHQTTTGVHNRFINNTKLTTNRPNSTALGIAHMFMHQKPGATRQP